MNLSLSREALTAYVAAQMSAIFPDRSIPAHELRGCIARALDRLEFCLERIRVKYGTVNGTASFNHLNTDQYAMFLYLVSHTAYRETGNLEFASKAYALNKALHALDAFYEVELPRVFLFQHPVGTVLGRAKYADYFMVYQRCSVGSSLERDYPDFREGVVMFGGSGVIGKCHIGSNAWLSVNSLVMNASVPDNSLVFGQSPNLIFKNAKRTVEQTIFGL